MEICYFSNMCLEKKNLIRILSSWLTILVIALWSSHGFAATEISNVRHWAAPDHTRVVFDLSAEPDYQFKIKDDVLTLVFKNASFHQSLPAEKIVDKPGISKIVFMPAGGNKCKIEIVLTQYIKAEVFKLKKFMDKPDRVVVDIIVQQAVKEEIAEEETTKEETAKEETTKEETTKERVRPSVKKRVIVIDPGHGGEDPGAIGKSGTYEKHVVLAIGREIKKTIDKIPGYRTVLTRDGDYYVSFNKRLQTARDANASLFISVHADAAKNRLASGSSVYCLSTGAASNEAAKLLANNENLSDIIGGVPNGEGNNQSDEIILNMFQTNTINLSKMYAAGLMDHLSQVHYLKYPTFHEAPFRVLKLLDIPAVLMETAFLSNAQEERMLKKSSFQKKIASAVALSVTNYFSGSSAVASEDNASKPDVRARAGSKAKSEDTRPIITISYQIKRGDTLYSVAKQFNTKVTTLLNLNHFKYLDPLYVGRKMLVPATDGEIADAKAVKAVKSYTVKKGDTLFSLSKSSSITVEELRRLNNMKNADTLLLGQKIKLPQ